MSKRNVHMNSVHGFGQEWTRFDQSGLPPEELNDLFECYFRLFPWEKLPPNPQGFDAGCGSGRWAELVAPKVSRLYCIDPSSALEVARRKLGGMKNCEFFAAAVDDMPLSDASMDFGYSLGVLHHIPDTARGLRDCVKKLKPGAPFLVYIYYAFENRPVWFRVLWSASEVLRLIISRLPYRMRYVTSQILAVSLYWPLARGARLAERLGVNVDSMPLSAYRHRTFYTMRTDALDRFGTQLEQRFTRSQIQAMMEQAGLEAIVFQDGPPYWCAMGYRKRATD